jgi:hypothetical protein
MWVTINSRKHQVIVHVQLFMIGVATVRCATCCFVTVHKIKLSRNNTQSVCCCKFSSSLLYIHSRTSLHSIHGIPPVKKVKVEFNAL